MKSIRIFPIPKLLWFILAVAFVLRLIGAWHGNLMYDESTHLACAETIDFRPNHFNLVFRSVDHPLMSVYIVKFSSLFFGRSNFGIRILHVLFGTLTVLLIYLLGKMIFSEKVGLLAASLLSIDQFHHTWSYFIVPEVLMLFFVSLSLIQFLRVLEKRTRGSFVILGILIGLCYLAKETSILLIPILWFYLLIHKDSRSILWSKNWLLTHLIALLVVSPDILWNLTHFYEGYFYRDFTLIEKKFSLSYRFILLYLGEIAHLFPSPIGQFKVNYATQNPSLCHWPAGSLYLIATIIAIFFWRKRQIRLLLMIFLSYLFFFTLLPSRFGVKAYWWPSISLLPAIIFAGHSLERLVDFAWIRFKSKVILFLPKILITLFFSLLGIRAISTAIRPGLDTPRLSAAQRVKLIIDDVSKSKISDELSRYEWGLTHTLHIVGPNADIYAYLARIAYERKQIDKAKYYIRHSLKLDENNDVALNVSELIKRSGF